MALFCCLCGRTFRPNASGDYNLRLIQTTPCQEPYVKHHVKGVL